MINKRTKILLFLTIIVFTTNSTAWSQASDSTSVVENALKLIHSPEPEFSAVPQTDTDPQVLADMGFEQVYQNKPYRFNVSDGKTLFAYKYPQENSMTTILLLHGVLSGAFMMNKTAGLLREATDAEVIALDLRGHGQSEGTPGDVEMINQYALDVVDVITAIKKEKSDQRIILAGHSMGGGIALQVAMLKKPDLVDGYLMFAPLLGYKSPTISKSPATKAGRNSQQFMRIHIKRIIGLKMLNSVGNHEYDHLPVLFFNLPDKVPIRTYSYRANESMTPEDYKVGLAAVDKPLLVLVGSNDESFVATEFEPVVTENSDGEVLIIEGATHNGIRHDERAMTTIRKWISNHKLGGYARWQ
ncbi:alpha/beta hydrolase [Aliifodinibius halophilus]|uniref:Alpha/beta hydrolase n=2 Tax=Fodinibius halophilus TaxID=1736908 RepID=A0A6M1T905_9BACT|nr:alpha/beta hydrolase [Fodinibius halophilus]